MFDLVKAAALTIKGIIPPTPLIFSTSLTKAFGFDSYLKLENLQKTGSFKVRGAYNKLISLTQDEKSRGVIAASSGNHAQGVAWAASLLGIKSTIVMPETAPITKAVATRGYGAQVLQYGGFFDDAYAYAVALAQERGVVFIPPFDDRLVIAGQGTIGLEIMETLPDADAVIVPVGGGGLISGIAAAVKGVNGDTRVIGVEAEAAMSCIASLKAGHPVDVEKKASIADGIAVKRVGVVTFPLIQKYVDTVVPVREETIASAIVQLLERKKLIVEGAGAVTLAAAMEGVLPKKMKKAVFVLSGGNIDVTTLDRVIRLGLLKEGRIMKISTVVPDAPGALARLTAETAALKANIVQIFHRRDAEDVLIGNTMIELILEVEGPEHARRVIDTLRDKGYEV